MTIFSKSEIETENAGEALARRLKPGSIAALYGELGAGKTAFVRGMARALGVKEQPSSPTFTVVNEYQGTIPLYHFDMYRLSGSRELYELGWDDYLERGGICAVEWSERVDDIFDGEENVVRVRLTRTDDTTRLIEIDI